MTDEFCVDGSLEIRARGSARMLTGSFPYDKRATVRSAGRVRKERFAPGSMSWQTERFAELNAELNEMVQSTVDQVRLELLTEELERRNTHLLVGHSSDKAIADTRTGNLKIKHTREAVSIEAELPSVDRQPSWVRDAVLAVEGGQLRGISPGFQVPAGKGGERLVPEPGNPGVMIREITDAVVFEYSLVARPAYASTEVDARADPPAEPRRRRLWL